MADLGKGEKLTGALERLASVIDSHAGRDTGISYTAKLLSGGPKTCAKKFGEEAVEFALAVAGEGEADVAAEAADALYHMLVALKARGVALDAVGAALASREGRSGLEEKASRPKN